MSFSVRDGSVSSKSHSPYAHAYKSPQVGPSSGHGLPPFSLPHTNTDEPPKRTGTDPTKYKTIICRNWEQNGVCTFRGCTFAHGVEELRAPVKLEMHSSPALAPQGMSANSTPKLTAQPARPLMQNKLEHLLDILYSEVIHTRELSSVHTEANRTLESMLRREQVLYEESLAQLDAKRARAMAMMGAVASYNAQILTWRDDADAQALLCRAADLLPTPSVPEGYSFTASVLDDDVGVDIPAALDFTGDFGVEELLRMLGPLSPTQEQPDVN